ncbi:putative MarR type transcriptional regulator [Staphylococcus piscifermentans]|uniref:MarR family transcriptional regulator n=1 Tax=Staphylococcus piscifermentans TaxID=70258 RepID=A0A239U9A6_9STAP|nr:MarR family transcriptional regulator [Staphylococcus piscifermentans]RTX82057.1 MarR family transcriptional regulator [Staphylococcus piscifermentans]GEP85270.1 MarR family transcriptional regulator [Staphylococcus piscifermentans]SNV06540.1 putative MarR type transcriptional regulator [Staphylococcus piscifermentans]
MYKQLEQQITVTHNDLIIVNKRFGQRANLTIEQIDLLRMLNEYHRLSQYDLTMKVGKEQSIVSRWIKKLVQLGYVISHQSHQDLRCKELEVTDKSRILINQINEARQELIEARCERLSETDVKQLHDLLVKLNKKSFVI